MLIAIPPPSPATSRAHQAAAAYAFPGRDLRERKVALTEKGEAILLRALPNWRAAQSDVVASLSRAE